MHKRSIAQRVISGSSLIIFSQASSLLLVLFAQRIILSTLTKEDNGILYFERRFTEFAIGIFVEFGLSGIILRRVAQNPSSAGRIISSALAFRFVMWSVATVLCVAYAVVSGYSPLDVFLWSLCLLVASRSSLLRYTIETYRRSKSKFGLVTSLAVLDSVLFLAFIVLWQDSLSPSRVILSLVLSAIPGFLILLALDRGRTVRFSNIQMLEVRSLVKEALPLMLALVLLSIHASFDALLLGWTHVAKEVGILGAVYTTIGPFLVMIPLSISLATAPEITKMSVAHVERRNTLIVSMIRHFTYLVTALAIVMSALLPFVLHVVTNDVYSDNITQFFWFVWAAPPAAILIFSQEYFTAANAGRMNLILASILLATTVVAALLLIPPFASIGAVISRLVALFIGAISAMVFLRKNIGQQLPVSLLIGSGLVFFTGLVTSFIVSTQDGSVVLYLIPLVLVSIVAKMTNVLQLSDIANIFRLLRR